MRIRLDLSYDGTHFRGWARQPGLRTVQETLRRIDGRIEAWSPGENGGSVFTLRLPAAGEKRA